MEPPGGCAGEAAAGATLATAWQIGDADVARDVLDPPEAVEPHTDVLTLRGMIAFLPGVARGLAGSGTIVRLTEPGLASGNSTLTEATAVAAATLLTEAPEAAGRFPPPARIREAAAGLAAADPGAERALLRLAQVPVSPVR